MKVNLEQTIARHEEERRRRPHDHALLARLGRAYERKRDLAKMASVFEQASVLAPTYANYFAKLGAAQLELGSLDAARASMQACVAKDPNMAECHRALGVIEEHAGHWQAALGHYSEAARREPTSANAFLALAQLYFALKLFAAAQATIEEGVRLVPPREATVEELGKLHLLSSYVALARGDRGARVEALQRACTYDRDSHHEYAFELGMALAAVGPPGREKAARSLTRFVRRACRPNAVPTEREALCIQAQATLAEISGTADVTGTP